MNKIAVYGSLKKGAYNHIPEMGEPIAFGKVRGTMYTCIYPWLTRDTGEDSAEHELEVYEVSDEVFSEIQSMEIGAGYTPEHIMVDGHDCIMYWYDKDVPSTAKLIKEYSTKTVPSAFIGY